jgi:flavin-binding protein dodecin
MSANTYKVVELVGSSTDSIEDAIRGAIAQASVTLRHLDWFEVVQTRVHIADCKVGHFQVHLKIGVRIEYINVPGAGGLYRHKTHASCFSALPERNSELRAPSVTTLTAGWRRRRSVEMA